MLSKSPRYYQVRLITTGGDAEAEREQWNDANNVLTLRPGVVRLRAQHLDSK